MPEKQMSKVSLTIISQKGCVPTITRSDNDSMSADQRRQVSVPGPTAVRSPPFLPCESTVKFLGQRRTGQCTSLVRTRTIRWSWQ